MICVHDAPAHTDNQMHDWNHRPYDWNRLTLAISFDGPLVHILVQHDHTVNRAHGTQISILNSCIPRVDGKLLSCLAVTETRNKDTARGAIP